MTEETIHCAHGCDTETPYARIVWCNDGTAAVCYGGDEVLDKLLEEHPSFKFIEICPTKEKFDFVTSMDLYKDVTFHGLEKQ